MTELTAKKLRETLVYDANTGFFSWAVQPSKAVKIGDKVKIVGGGRQQGEVLEIRNKKFKVILGGCLVVLLTRPQFVVLDNENR